MGSRGSPPPKASIFQYLPKMEFPEGGPHEIQQIKHRCDTIHFREFGGPAASMILQMPYELLTDGFEHHHPRNHLLLHGDTERLEPPWDLFFFRKLPGVGGQTDQASIPKHFRAYQRGQMDWRVFAPQVGTEISYYLRTRNAPVVVRDHPQNDKRSLCLPYTHIPTPPLWVTSKNDLCGHSATYSTSWQKAGSYKWQGSHFSPYRMSCRCKGRWAWLRHLRGSQI